jgi:hypothetical protein
MDVDRQPLARVQELDEQRGIGSALGGVVGAEEAGRVRTDRVAQQLAAREPTQPKTVVVDPTQSSGTRGPGGRVPRRAAIAGPPR